MKIIRIELTNDNKGTIIVTLPKSDTGIEVEIVNNSNIPMVIVDSGADYIFPVRTGIGGQVIGKDGNWVDEENI